MLAILAACHGYFACGNKVLFCSVLEVVYHQSMLLFGQDWRLCLLSVIRTRNKHFSQVSVTRKRPISLAIVCNTPASIVVISLHRR